MLSRLLDCRVGCGTPLLGAVTPLRARKGDSSPECTLKTALPPLHVPITLCLGAWPFLSLLCLHCCCRHPAEPRALGWSCSFLLRLCPRVTHGATRACPLPQPWSTNHPTGARRVLGHGSAGLQPSGWLPKHDALALTDTELLCP